MLDDTQKPEVREPATAEEPKVGFHVNRRKRKVARYATGTKFISADGRKEYVVAPVGNLVLLREDRNGGLGK